MRVLFVTSSYPANHDDSRGHFIQVLAAALVELGVGVTVLAPGAPGALRHDGRDGVCIRRVTYWIPRWQTLASSRGGGIVPSLRRRPWLILQAAALIATLTWYAILLARRADVIHAHWVIPGGLAGVLAARLTGKPLVVTSHGTDLDLAGRTRTMGYLARKILRRADTCVGVSRALSETIVALGVARERVCFIPLGVPLATPGRSDTLPAGRAWAEFRDARRPKFLYVGRLIAGKAVASLLEAAKLASSKGAAATYAIIGSGPEMPRLQAQAMATGAGFAIFAGERPPSEIGAWLGEADGLILPSLSEGRPVVVLEAMAAGRAVIASDLPGIRELVVDGSNGVLFPAGNAESLANILARLIRDPQTLRSMGTTAAMILEREGLSAAACARRHRAMYGALAEMKHESQLS